jgi:subtilisin family serine protease
VPFEVAADKTSFADNGIGHGTHVAGIVAGRGVRNRRFRGLAPAVDLYSFRVYARDSFKAEDTAITEAIESAIEEGCHLINISLGGDNPVREISDALLKAAAAGIVVIAAAGNDGRKSVQYPANHPSVLGVGALGDRDRIPNGTMSAAAFVSPTRGRVPNVTKGFIGNFSNMGPEIDLTGPGVGIISTYPGSKYAVSDGTSMAAPAVTGWTARLLSQHPEVLAMAPDQRRTAAITGLILENASQLGFGDTLEGQGLLK